MVVILPTNCCVLLDDETHALHLAQNHHVCVEEGKTGGCSRIHTYGTQGCEISYKRLEHMGASDYSEWLSTIPNCCGNYLGSVILSLIGSNHKKTVYLQITAFDDCLLEEGEVPGAPHPGHVFSRTYTDSEGNLVVEEDSLSSELESVEYQQRSSESNASSIPKREGEEHKSSKADRKRKESTCHQSGVKRLQGAPAFPRPASNLFGKVVNPKILTPDWMAEFGLQQIVDNIEFQGWSELFSREYPIYSTLVMEFMAKLRPMEEGKRGLQLRSVVGDKEVVFDEGDLADTFSIRPIGDAFAKTVSWSVLGNKASKVVASFGCPTVANFSTTLLSVKDKILHSILLHNITPRSKRKDIVCVRDVILMNCLVSHQLINLPRQIIIAIAESRQVNEGLVHGGIISRMIEKAGVSLKGEMEEYRCSCESIGVEMLNTINIQIRGHKLIAEDPEEMVEKKKVEKKKVEKMKVEPRTDVSVGPGPRCSVKRSAFASSDDSVLPAVLATLEAIKAVSSESHVILMVEGSIAYVKKQLP